MTKQKMTKQKTTEPRPESLLSDFLETEEFSLKDSPMFQELIENIKNRIKNHLKGESSGHDWPHTFRVYKNSIKIVQRLKLHLQ